ncbi:MAG: hypothetical protein AAB214_07490 [Fibrobacterota bacterium]
MNAGQPFLSTPRTDWKSVALEVSKRLGKSYSGQYVREVASGWRNHTSIRSILQELGIIEKLEMIKLPRNPAIIADKATTEDSQIRLLRQRLTLARHLRSANLALRSARQELTEAHDRLAATSTKLGDAMTANFVLEVKLQTERETSARLEGVVRRMATRPRIKRGTTHVEIAGVLFSNRTGARA